jgi:hypothetical protein
VSQVDIVPSATPSRGAVSAGTVTAAETGAVRPSAGRPGAAARAAKKGRARSFIRRNAVLLDIVVLLAIVTTLGLGYYTASAAERLRSPLHAWFKPSGYVGQTAGIIAFLLFVFLWLYPLRKKFRFLAFTGEIGRWLDVHIVAGLVVPWVAAIHASFRFDGLIGLGYFAMLTVSCSGLIGKYLYLRIPRSRYGVELDRAEANARRTELVGEIARITGVDPAVVARSLEDATGAGRRLDLLGLVFNDIARWKATRALRRTWSSSGSRRNSLDRKTLSRAVRLARREIALTQQLRMLDVTHRLFRYWHIAHRPVAITALLAVTIHVAVVVVLGVTWFW